MAGHSKWNNIKRKKAKADAEKSNVTAKAVRDVMLAAKQGGSNPETNFRLKVAVDKAKADNVSNDAINRAIKRGAGETGENVDIEELTYEAYGPGGTAIMVEAATDNRNRTAGDVRHILTKNGAKLAEVGSVAWLFDQRGLIELKAEDMDEDDVLMAALEAGALDVESEEGEYVVYTEPQELDAVRKSFDEAGFEIDVYELTMVPKTTVLVGDEDAEKTLRLVDALEEHDDVVKVHVNFDIPEEVMARLG